MTTTQHETCPGQKKKKETCLSSFHSDGAMLTWPLHWELYLIICLAPPILCINRKSQPIQFVKKLFFNADNRRRRREGTLIATTPSRWNILYDTDEVHSQTKHFIHHWESQISSTPSVGSCPYRALLTLQSCWGSRHLMIISSSHPPPSQINYPVAWLVRREPGELVRLIQLAADGLRR